MVVVIMLTFLVLIMSGAKNGEHLTGQAVLKMVWLEKAVIYGCQLIHLTISVLYGWDLVKKVLIKVKTTSQYKSLSW